MNRLLTIVLLATVASSVSGRTYLRADGISSSTYDLLDSVLGGTAYEVPDCGHSGAHITQAQDSELGVPVFHFASHINSDSDRCINYDRVRTEIKTYEPSPDAFKGFRGESVTYSWDVRLNSAFQPSTAFTHIFQVKAVGGDDSQPLITITPRLRSGSKILEVIHSGTDSSPNTIWTDDLSKYVGKWLHIVAEYTCELNSRFHLRIKNKLSGEQLMEFTSNSIDMWRNGNSFLRPKWGIYRSLSDKGNLRDENVYFNNFCLGKGDPVCN